MKFRLIYIGLASFFISCGGTEESTDSNTTPVDNEDDSSSVEMPDNFENEEDFTPESANMDIRDYIEILLGGPVRTEVPESGFDTGDMGYYELLDVSNGYAKVTGPYEGWYEFALWRMDDGEKLVCKTSGFCGPVCDYSYEFFLFDAAGEKRVVTEEVLPMDEINEYKETTRKDIAEREELEYEDDAQLWFRPPQKGTSMEVFISVGANEIEVPMLILGWDKKKFSVESVY